jgi:plasmid replication initiation protein
MTTETLPARLRNAISPLHLELHLDSECTPELRAAAEMAVARVLDIAREQEPAPGPLAALVRLRQMEASVRATGNRGLVLAWQAAVGEATTELLDRLRSEVTL